MKLTDRQRRFVELYVLTGNVENSALEAGYSQNYARSQSYKLLAHVGVKRLIDEKLAEIANERIMDAQEALELLTGIARAEITEEVVIPTEDGYVKVDKIPDIRDRQRAVESILKRYPINKNEELKDKLLETQIRKLEKELETDTSVEDKLQDYFEALGGAFTEKES